MDWQLSLLLLTGLLVVFMAIGMPVVFAFLAVNIVGSFVFLGGMSGEIQLLRNIATSVNNFTLTPILLFVMMGEIMFHTGVAFRAIVAIERVIANIPGRLAIVSIFGGTAFATLSGSSIANTALMGKTLLPQMLERGYEKRTAMGPLMAAGGIAMLIPPSALAVLLGSLAEISIEKLLIGGIVPGIMMAVFFLAYIIIHCLKNPDVAPVYQTAKLTRAQRWKPFLVDVLPLFAIFAVVVGSMLKGWASPTEASALGAISCFIAAAAYRALTFDNFRKSLLETAKVSVMILFILVASSTFSLLLSFSGATSGLLEALSTIRLTPLETVIGMIVILLILGCFVDQVSMIMLTLPFFMPIAQTMGIDTVWLGLLILISMEIGFITPPFGMLLIVMQGVAPSGTRFVDVYRAAYPYLLIEILVLGLLIAFPQLATSLPNLVGTL